MTEKPFKASNGWTVQKSGEYHKSVDVRDRHGGYVKWISPSTLETLAEYFQHERDQQLGRVRWPENPDYVIYRVKRSDDEDGRCVLVFHEPNAVAMTVWERFILTSNSPSKLAARWYFTEGPGKEPERPWEDAQAGEVWRLTVDGEEGTFLVCENIPGKPYFLGRASSFYTSDPGITAGRKLLEADGSEADDRG